MAEAVEHSALIQQIAFHLDADPAVLRLEPITTGKHNASFWVISESKRWVLRVAPPDSTGLLFYEWRMMRQEPALHRLICARTTLPVAPIIAADFSRAYFDCDYVLMEALPGVPLSEATGLTHEQRQQTLLQVGQALRQLHALIAPDCLDRDSYGYIGDHHPMEPQPTWIEAFRTMWHLLLDDIVASGCYTTYDRQFMSDLLDRHLPCFDYTQPACLLHMDVWSQNVLVDSQGNLTGLIDFDRALWGDPEIEFAVLDYCGISEPAFWQGYGIDRDRSPAAEMRQRFYLLYELQKYMPIALWRRNDEQRALNFKQKSFALASTLNLIGNRKEKVSRKNSLSLCPQPALGNCPLTLSQPEVVQPTSNFHHRIGKVIRSSPQGIHHNIAPLDAANLMLYLHSLP